MCTIALAGYLDTQIQSKMGRWRGATFKEGRLQSWLGQVRTLYEPVPYHQAKKQQPKSTTKNTTIMTSHPIILHQWLYLSAYTPLPLEIYGNDVGGLAGCAW